MKFLQQRRFFAWCAALPLSIATMLSLSATAVAQNSSVNVFDLFLYMEEDDLNELYTRDIFSGDRLNGVIRQSPDGEDLELRGLRFRGNTTRFSPKKSFNIRFEDRQDFLYNSSRMNLNAMYTDPSMMREQLAWSMFAQLNQPASRTQYFNLYINDSFEGFYNHIERVDSDLLRNGGLDPDGTLVRDQLRRSDDPRVNRDSIFGFDLGAIANPEEFLDDNFNSRGNPDWSAVVEFVDWVNQSSPGTEFAQEFNQRVDSQNFTDWLAVHYLIGDVDSFGDDYWMHRSQTDPDGKWAFIPWDKDLTFGAFERPVEDPLERQLHDFFYYEYPLTDGGWDNQLVSNFLATPELRSQLESRLEQLMQEEFTLEYFRQRIEAIAAVITDSVNKFPEDGRFNIHPQNHHGELGRFESHLENLLDFVELRYQFLDRQINPVTGEPYVARVDLSNYRSGDTVLLTDAQGWTIAKLHLTDIVNRGWLSIAVEQNTEVFGIDRLWTIETDSQVTGDLTLYYRNTIDAEFGGENWYYEPVAIGNQWNLQLANLLNDSTTALSSQVNPYSNKVTGTVSLNGWQQYVLTDSSTRVAVPEPGTVVVILIMGSFGLVSLKKRHFE